MDIGRHDKHGFCVVDVIGRIDKLMDANVLRSYVASLAEANEKIVAVNLSQVTYLDSGALNVLIYSQNILDKLGGQLVLIEPSEYVSDVLNIVGFDKLITIYHSEKEFADEVKKLKRI